MKKSRIILFAVLVLSNFCFAKIPTKSLKTSFKSFISKITTIPITEAENIDGLKKSLEIGIEKAVAKLGVENGFLNDSIYKLLLPREAQSITDNLKYIPGGKELVEKTIVSLNRTAEDAVKDATPIFKTAITNMTITDVTNVLFGKEDAATEYLKQKTLADLTIAFAPKVKASLDKPLVAGVSTNQTWGTLYSGYNSAANSTIGKLAKLKSVDANLENYVNEKALEALFAKIAEQEKVFRKDPKARTSDLLKKVFGQLDKK